MEAGHGRGRHRCRATALERKVFVTVQYVADSRLPTPWGGFTMVGFEDLTNGKEHVALVFGRNNFV